MNDTKIWAHRGASGYAPENSLEAFERAVRLGADGVELDIQMTRDGELVVIHDERIDRVSNGSGMVGEYTLSQLRQYDFNRTNPEFSNVKIPTLEEVYDLLRGTNLDINVELKTGICFYDGLAERVLELTGRMGLVDKVWFSSFNHYSICKLKELNPKVKTGLLYSDGICDPVGYAIMATGNGSPVDALHPAWYNLQYPGVVDKAKVKNMKVHVWTVNSEEHARVCFEKGVDAIITNYPDLAREWREMYDGGKRRERK